MYSKFFKDQNRLRVFFFILELKIYIFIFLFLKINVIRQVHRLRSAQARFSLGVPAESQIEKC